MEELLNTSSFCACLIMSLGLSRLLTLLSGFGGSILVIISTSEKKHECNIIIIGNPDGNVSGTFRIT